MSHTHTRVEHHTRKSVNVTFRAYHEDKDSFAEVTHWNNGEGFDFVVVDPAGRNERFSLSRCEANAVLALMGHVDLREPTKG